MDERRRETEKERDIYIERRGSETDVTKLYTYNKYEHSVLILELNLMTKFLESRCCGRLDVKEASLSIYSLCRLQNLKIAYFKGPM